MISPNSDPKESFWLDFSVQIDPLGSLLGPNIYGINRLRMVNCNENILSSP